MSHVEIKGNDEQMVLNTFGRYPNMCIHQLHLYTSISYVDLLKITKMLEQKGKIFRVPELCLGSLDQQFCARHIDDGLASEQFEPTKLSPLIGLTEEQMINRVRMLKRMKRLTICDWHPVIDVLLEDYERDIKRMGIQRWGPDVDADTAPDCLDRDLEQENADD